jgi:phosphatidylglycerophosphatase C
MGMSGPVRQGEVEFRPLVAFDFDGTLTCRDSFREFLAWRSGPLAYGLGLATLTTEALAWTRHRDRGRLKSAMVRQFLKGVTRGVMESSALAFAAVRSGALLRPDALRCWRQWQVRGARLIIVTASPEIIVAPFAHGLGAETLIGTRLAFDAGDRLTGDLDGANCRGPEKVVRLREILGDGVRLEAAYGDSDGDLDMLALADEPGMKVFGGRP